MAGSLAEQSIEIDGTFLLGSGLLGGLGLGSRSLGLGRGLRLGMGNRYSLGEGGGLLAGALLGGRALEAGFVGSDVEDGLSAATGLVGGVVDVVARALLGSLLDLGVVLVGDLVEVLLDPVSDALGAPSELLAHGLGDHGVLDFVVSLHELDDGPVLLHSEEVSGLGGALLRGRAGLALRGSPLDLGGLLGRGDLGGRFGEETEDLGALGLLGG